MTDWDWIATARPRPIRMALEDVADIVDDTLDKIRLGVYDESLHGSLKDVLETIEGRLGE